jgi:hypothetical protein
VRRWEPYFHCFLMHCYNDIFLPFSFNFSLSYTSISMIMHLFDDSLTCALSSPFSFMKISFHFHYLGLYIFCTINWFLLKMPISIMDITFVYVLSALRNHKPPARKTLRQLSLVKLGFCQAKMMEKSVQCLHAWSMDMDRKKCCVFLSVHKRKTLF